MCEHMFLILLGVYLRGELLGRTVAMFIVFEKLTNFFAKAATPFYITLSNV